MDIVILVIVLSVELPRLMVRPHGRRVFVSRREPPKDLVGQGRGGLLRLEVLRAVI